MNAHPWLGTQHCLRESEGKDHTCCNDHTGCLWNDGHNCCMHPAKVSNRTGYDSPLMRRIDTGMADDDAGEKSLPTNPWGKNLPAHAEYERRWNAAKQPVKPILLRKGWGYTDGGVK